MRFNKTLRPAIDAAEAMGYQVGLTRNNHVKFTKRGRRTIFTSYTPSDTRSVKNVICQLRRNERGVQP